MDKFRINIYYDENSYDFYDLIDEVIEQFVKEKIKTHIWLLF